MPDNDKYSNVLKADTLTTESGMHYAKGDEVPLEDLAKEDSSAEEEKERLGEADALYSNEELEELQASNAQQEEARQADIAQVQDDTLEQLNERDKADAESQEKVSTRGRPKVKK